MSGTSTGFAFVGLFKTVSLFQDSITQKDPARMCLHGLPTDATLLSILRIFSFLIRPLSACSHRLAPVRSPHKNEFLSFLNTLNPFSNPLPLPLIAAKNGCFAPGRHPPPGSGIYRLFPFTDGSSFEVQESALFDPFMSFSGSAGPLPGPFSSHATVSASPLLHSRCFPPLDHYWSSLVTPCSRVLSHESTFFWDTYLVPQTSPLSVAAGRFSVALCDGLGPPALS